MSDLQFKNAFENMCEDILSWDDILHSAVQYFVTDCVGGMGGFLPSETSRLVLSFLLAEGLTDTR